MITYLMTWALRLLTFLAEVEAPVLYLNDTYSGHILCYNMVPPKGVLSGLDKKQIS